ncbi:MAG: efflux RND transporter periplasmic adaptor subunit [Candidatus Cloacimonetes bacterium]|nr:efflux RND transporter periplasmic adaptor subunit [Candidatus Cloacimonadota bacterium]
MKKNKSIIIFAIILILVYSGCSRKEQIASKNIEQIHKEEGVPIKILILEPSSFELWLSYNAPLKGIRQTNVASMVQAEVEKVNAVVGSQVTEGDVLVEFPEDTPSAQFLQAKSAYENAQTTYDRLINLFEIGGISKQDLDGAETAYKVSKANWDAVRKMIKAEAPISGIVTTVDVKVSDNVFPGDILFIVSDTEKMKARVWVTEQEVCDIKKGMKAEASWLRNTLSGSVTQIGLALDSNLQAFPVDIVFDNPDNIHACGVTARIKILVYNNAEALKVARKNIREDENGYYVYILKDGQAVKRAITLGQQNGTEVEVLTGLKSGDKIITEGLNMIKDGVKVKVIQ